MQVHICLVRPCCVCVDACVVDGDTVPPLHSPFPLFCVRVRVCAV